VECDVKPQRESPSPLFSWYWAHRHHSMLGNEHSLNVGLEKQGHQGTLHISVFSVQAYAGTKARYGVN